MERIEVNVETGEVQIIQLTAEEISAAQSQYAEWQENQHINPPPPSILDLQTQIAELTTQISNIQSKVGA